MRIKHRNRTYSHIVTSIYFRQIEAGDIYSKNYRAARTTQTLWEISSRIEIKMFAPAYEKHT